MYTYLVHVAKALCCNGLQKNYRKQQEKTAVVSEKISVDGVLCLIGNCTQVR